MLVENVAWFLLGAGVTNLVWFGIYMVPFIRRRRREKKFASFVERVRNSVDDAAHCTHPDCGDWDGSQPEPRRNKEISELQFRDCDGALCKVEIVIDPEIDLSEEDKTSFRDMITRNDGAAGSMEVLLGGHTMSEGAMNKIEKFVFSAQSVEQMRAVGMEPDEVVRSMLKSSGRIA